MLRAVGLTEFDERVYRALLRQPDATPEDLAPAVKSAPKRAFGALSRLVELGLARATEDDRFVPNDPDPALEALVHRRQAELHAARSAATELAVDFRVGSLRTQPSELVEVVTGREEIYRRSMELYGGATREIMGFERPPYVVPPDFDELGAEQPLLDRGVRMRVVYSSAALAPRAKFGTVSALIGQGEQARTLPDLPLKLLIVDARCARVSLASDAHATDSVAFIRESGLLDALIALFEAYWERAHPIGGPGSPALTADEARVLELLGAGFKDEAIARNLNTSMRTTSRRVLRILELLGSSTRFQAGAQAVRRGWL